MELFILRNKYWRSLVGELNVVLIGGLAELVADHVTPRYPTDRDIGEFGISPLIDTVKHMRHFVSAACKSDNVEIIKPFIPNMSGFDIIEIAKKASPWMIEQVILSGIDTQFIMDGAARVGKIDSMAIALKHEKNKKLCLKSGLVNAVYARNVVATKWLIVNEATANSHYLKYFEDAREWYNSIKNSMTPEEILCIKLNI